MLSRPVRLTRRDRARRITKTALLLVALLLLYFIVGAVVPFASRAATGNGSGDPSRYRGDAAGVERAGVIEENEDALAWRLRLIGEAQEEIILTTYQYKVGESADLLGAAFLEAADRGVRILLLIDGFSGVNDVEGEVHFETLSAHPNIEIRLYNRFDVIRPWAVNGRLHEKCFIVDDLAYIVGGRNTHDDFLGDSDTSKTNDDREVLIYNTAHGGERSDEASIHALRDYVMSVWDGKYTSDFRDRGAEPADRRIREERARLSALAKLAPDSGADGFDAFCEANTYPTDRITLISGESHIYGKKPIVWSEMKQLMLSATERVWFQTPYIMCTKEMYGDLADISGAIGDFRMITNSIVNTDNKFSPADYLYHQDEILRTGVSVYEFDGGHSIHTKTVLIDRDLVMIGSFNVDPRSVYMNTEIMIVIDSEELNQAISEHMHDVLGKCELVSEENGNTVDIRAKEAPFFERIWWYAFGVILIPFRFAL
jgi:phosphatidylserine/phosphatidylglycerophosphate/cardiolipin synthase-like enzyme